MKQYVAYYRVSTKQQGKDGNGMKAQQAAVRQFLAPEDEIIEMYTEVESGTNGNRPILSEAVERCKETGAKLLVAKLDRLSRNVKFLFTLKEELEQAGVGFVIADLPEANNTMILGVMASMAQHEADLISERTKKGIEQSEVYKAGQWGNSQNLTDAARAKAHKAVRRNARRAKANRHAFHFIQPRRENQGQSYTEIAEALNAEGYRTRQGKKFYPATVRRIYLRYTEESN